MHTDYLNISGKTDLPGGGFVLTGTIVNQTQQAKVNLFVATGQSVYVKTGNPWAATLLCTQSQYNLVYACTIPSSQDHPHAVTCDNDNPIATNVFPVVSYDYGSGIIMF